MTANLDTKALRALEAKATPGPWGKTPFEEKNDVCIWSPEGKWLANVGNWGNCQLVVEGENGPDVIPHPELERIETGHDANAELIVAIRNAAPALLDAAEERDKNSAFQDFLAERVEQLQAERDQLLAEVSYYKVRYPKLRECFDERDALKAENESLRAELSWIDSVLARRPALDKPTRAANIEHAINVAKQADALRAEVERLTAERIGLIGEVGAASTRANRAEAEVERMHKQSNETFGVGLDLASENERLREVIQGLRQRQRSDLDERDATNPACPTIDAARKPHDVRARLGE